MRVDAEADAWLARHGRYAYALAGQRSMDAFMLGDEDEQALWHDVRKSILERVASLVSAEDTMELAERLSDPEVDD